MTMLAGPGAQLELNKEALVNLPVSQYGGSRLEAKTGV